MNWIATNKQKPENGTIVEIRTRKAGCSCAGYQTVECYYDDGEFKGIKTQSRVDYWRISPANDLIKEIDLRKVVVAKECQNCIA